MKKDKNNKIEIKEIRFGPSIADHDLEIKANAINKFFDKEDNIKVKVTITYKGRMQAYIKEGVKKLTDFSDLIKYPHKIAAEPKIEGNRVTMVIVPLK